MWGMAGYRKSELELKSRQFAWIFFVHLHEVPGTMAKKSENEEIFQVFFRISVKVPGTLRIKRKKRWFQVPREPRIYIEKVLYLITSKGLEDRDLFLDYQDYAEYLKSLSEYKNEYGFKLYAYALLPKRLCLLVELQNGVTISTIMHNLNSKYTKMYNSRYGKKGHLFQSRFKSILVEKEDYLLRLTRYIHLLPTDSAVTESFSDYAYSSYPMYKSESNQNHIGLDSPNMSGEINEVLERLLGSGSYAEKIKAYEGYVRAADSREIETVGKLLHRTAFVGSKDFIETVRKRIKNHKREEEESKIVRKINPAYAFAGSLVVLFLSVVTYNFYNSQTSLQEALNVTTSGFGVAQDELAKRVYSLENELIKFESTDELDGSSWVIHITPLNGTSTNNATTGKVYFKNGQVVIQKLPGQGFPAYNYTLTTKSNGLTVWKTARATVNGSVIQMEGSWTGKKVKGLVRERPAEGKRKDFTFVSVRRVTDTRRARNVVQ